MAVLAGPLMAQPPIHIAGTVRASGWTIEVQPLDGSDNFVRCVTLPLHGPTQADVLATQFVTEDNRKLPEAKLSHVKKREFQFVLNAKDQKKACAEMEEEAYGKPKTAPDGTVIIGNPGYEEPPLGNGNFLIKTVQLSNLGPSRHARLDSLSFEVEIALPAGKNRSSNGQR